MSEIEPEWEDEVDQQCGPLKYATGLSFIGRARNDLEFALIPEKNAPRRRQIISAD
ncbi:hypothetical protein OCU04_002147 [Sclerotinia nivalis]|uniref:Uncharacterized protein n=1 Tax=Sclerotinia nivalis TaxID=352851 RepID=A0A9X0AZI6_9HELO|nr:hypothetical protein OCU04_002147 [Sclerotinia nivalis]